jgi:CIC family chloride channel protein
LGAFVRNSGYLCKWLILVIVIGVIAGLGAVVFYLALKYTGEFFLARYPVAAAAACSAVPPSVSGRS